MKTLLPTSTAGSLPKPTWLAQPETLWSPWKLQDDELLAGKQDALRLSLDEQLRAGIDIVSIPYKGAAPALTDLAAGQIPLGFDAIPAAAAGVKNGRIKPIAVSTAERSPMFPDVPTIAESGFPGFKMESWFAIVGPSGIPADTQKKLEKALLETLASKETFDKLAAAGIMPGFQPASSYLSLVRDDIVKLKPIAEKANMQQD